MKWLILLTCILHQYLNYKCNAQSVKLRPYKECNCNNVWSQIHEGWDNGYLAYNFTYTVINPDSSEFKGCEIVYYDGNLDVVDSLFLEKYIQGLVQQNDSIFLICSPINAVDTSKWEVLYLSPQLNTRFIKEIPLNITPGNTLNYIRKVKANKGFYYLVPSQNDSLLTSYIIKFDSFFTVKFEKKLDNVVNTIDMAFGDSTAVLMNSRAYFFDQNWNNIKELSPPTTINPTLESAGYRYHEYFEVLYNKGRYQVLGPAAYDTVYLDPGVVGRTDEQIALYQYNETGKLLKQKVLGNHDIDEDIMYLQGSKLLAQINDTTLFVLGRHRPRASIGSTVQILGMRIFNNGARISENNAFGETSGAYYYPYSVTYFKDRKELLAIGNYSKCAGCKDLASYIIRFKEDFLLGITKQNILEVPFLTLYPNPSSTKINLELNTPSTAIEIYSSTGVKVLNLTINQGDKKHTLDISTLANGLYFVKTWNNNTLTGLGRFTVQH